MMQTQNMECLNIVQHDCANCEHGDHHHVTKQEQGAAYTVHPQLPESHLQ